MIDSLPPRPLFGDEMDDLIESGNVLPVSTVPLGAGHVEVYSVLVETEGTVHGLGYDHASRCWEEIVREPLDVDGYVAASQTLRDWAIETYDHEHVTHEVI